MQSLLAGVGPVGDGDGDGVADVDDASAGVNDGAEGQSQDRLLRLEDYLERVPIHHGFWPLLYLKYVCPHRDDFHHPHSYVAVSGEPYAAADSRLNRQVDQYSVVDFATDVQDWKCIGVSGNR